ncbi:MAG: LutB/LldF family L-lactate oxidation iron-sulfur protein [Gammaproteobacteria bacterium]|nr:LutB/LldF family L-lactate oxidation iron-sulfur protein [Gammaproteobacteria bacterium]MDH3464703.1 LutB/LldF family L-lactate oxidation iron-sulfur protein [Gammaproteobacteria bacterium]
MQSVAHEFKAHARRALQDTTLQHALARAKGGFIDQRRTAIEALPEFDELRACAKQIKNHTLAHLDYYLERYEAQVKADGGQVHWARGPEEARRIVIDICRAAGARRITKGKSMVGEEIAINPALEAAGFEAIETDLGEYIIQLAKEPPSHIIAPAVHKTRGEITELFYAHHRSHGINERVSDVASIVNEARSVLREAFVTADVGITGANFLVAQTGSSILVTNEGNGDLTCSLPRVHIVTASIEKVVPTLEDLAVFLRLLGRSATGQEMSSYTSIFTGPKRNADLDGPAEYHVVLLDHGRSAMLGNEFREMLRCIRCGACLNHCPVYGSIGGHSYGWVYSGPMGAVLTPLMVGLREAADLPNACTLNGRCQEVCPMGIPLPTMLRRLRMREFEQNLTGARSRWLLSIWAFLAKRPRLYQTLLRPFVRLLAIGSRGTRRSLPLARGWTQSRDFPTPQGRTFQSLYRARQRKQ